MRPKAGGERKSKDFYTVLILGRDTGGGGNTDTMLLASYDVTNQKATVMSIPRDTMVNVPWDIKKINSVYNYYGGGDKGIQALYKEIAQLVGFEPDYQVVLEWDAVGEIVDAMGGVYYDVPRNMNYDDPYQDLHIHQTKGYRKLSGSDVMQVLRYRHDNDMRYGYPDGDLGRIKTQQTLLKAMIEQLLQLKNVTKIGDFARAVKNNVTSDLTFEEMLWFGSQAVMGGLTIDSVNFVTMPNTGQDGVTAVSYRRNAFLRGAERAGAFGSRQQRAQPVCRDSSQCATLTSCPSTRMARCPRPRAMWRTVRLPSRRTTIPPPAHRPAQGTAARRPIRVRPPIPAIPATTAARRSTPAIPVTTAAVRPLIRATRAITAARPRQASPPRLSIP